MTSTTLWRADELIRRSTRDWKRLLGEDGHTGTRAEVFRKDHDSIYTATHSVFPAPLCEWILLRYGGNPGNSILDAFAGGAVRGAVASLMGFSYLGFEIRQEQIDENSATLTRLGLSARYVLSDGRFMGQDLPQFDCGLTCPPYHSLEKYSDLPNDLSNMRTYEEFNAGIFFCAKAYFKHLKPDAFCCIVTGLFRDKLSGELIDFPAHTALNFQEAGFLFWQSITLAKNPASAPKRASNAWKGLKLVPASETLLVFRKAATAKGACVNVKERTTEHFDPSGSSPSQG
jgi:DNA modification methylase